MKVFKPKPFYACCVEACDYSWHADRLIWTSEGWMCRDCEDEWMIGKLLVTTMTARAYLSLQKAPSGMGKH